MSIVVSDGCGPSCEPGSSSGARRLDEEAEPAVRFTIGVGVEGAGPKVLLVTRVCRQMLP